MKKVVMFGAGDFGKRYFYNPWRKNEIVAVLDNNSDLHGKFFEDKVPIIGIDEYMMKYRDCEIVITMAEHSDVEKQLQSVWGGGRKLQSVRRSIKSF